MKSVTVRAAVAVDPATGKWDVFGMDGENDFGLCQYLPIWAKTTTPQITYITAEIPIREVPEIRAEVEK